MNLIILIVGKYFIFVIALFVCVYLFSLYGNTKKFYKNVFYIFSSTVFAWIIAHVLKDIIKHPRPDQLLSLIKDGTYSFPSGHTTFISALGYLMSNISKKVGYTIIGLALIVGFSRVLAGVHYWYDILGGFILGIGVACIVTLLAKRLIRK